MLITERFVTNQLGNFSSVTINSISIDDVYTLSWRDINGYRFNISKSNVEILSKAMFPIRVKADRQILENDNEFILVSVDGENVSFYLVTIDR